MKESIAVILYISTLKFKQDDITRIFIILHINIVVKNYR